MDDGDLALRLERRAFERARRLKRSGDGGECGRASANATAQQIKRTNYPGLLG